MKMVKKLLNPSRPDAVRLRRSEKMALFQLMYVASVLEDIRVDLAERLTMIPDGQKRMDEFTKTADELLSELRVTAPENQRISMQNTATDYEMRLTPVTTPCSDNVLLTKEEFRELVDSARVRCRECTDDDSECEKCGLYQLLTSILPMESYHSLNLCPYNLGEWVN